VFAGYRKKALANPKPNKSNRGEPRPRVFHPEHTALVLLDDTSAAHKLHEKFEGAVV